jgi:FlaA1/EpsC-like NDP-sugar epimerase
MRWLLSQLAAALLRLRNRHFFLLDLAVLAITPILALLLRIDTLEGPARYAPGLLSYAVWSAAISLAVFYLFGLYRRYWRYASVEELVIVALALLTASSLVIVIFFGLRLPALGDCPAGIAACSLPRSLPFIDGLLTVLAVGASRFSVRLAELWLRRQRPAQPHRRALIMGAGEAGLMIVREMRANPQLGLEPVGFVDDDPHKQHMRIRNLTVLGTSADIPRLVQEKRADEVIIAMPTAPGKAIRGVLEICQQAHVPARTMPGVYELLDGAVSISQLRPVQIEDLLRRAPVQIDETAVRAALRGKRVLVTGGGGSIGSELCRQVLRCQPAQLILLGHGENSIFDTHNELLRLAPPSLSSYLVPVLADIRCPERLQAVFERYRPEVVFHAAAHKHVPLMEQHPVEAVTNNVLGTRYVLQAAQAVGVERFVLISTDKAVNPTSVMGASKRAAELLVHQVAGRADRPYVAVRFGNVLGSRGSVVLTFKQQIAAGGPLTITHPEVTRYFMTIAEAVQLVLQAAALGRGSEVFVLDMGEPLKIVDLARDLIRLSGLQEGRDVDIEFTGLRPGEKLYEELFIACEAYQRTAHHKLFVAANTSQFVPPDLDAAVEALRVAAAQGDDAAVLRLLRALVPEFQPACAAVQAPPQPAPPAAAASNSPLTPPLAALPCA